MSSGKINVLLVGGGGREHAIAAGLARSPRLGTLFTTHPENPGLATLAEPVGVPVGIREIYRLRQFCDRNDIGLVVVGPEDPLAEGFADELATDRRLVFGPRRSGAKLEADKAWAKQIMRGASIPTAESRVFEEADAADEYLRSREQPPVVKAAGLARGKGVFVPETVDEALVAVDRIMRRREFGESGARVVLEERLSGPEVSVLALTDGRSILVLPPAQDHKRLGDGDTGPNTGGMGAFCPATTIDAETMDRIERQVLVPVVDALRREEIEYRGVLYAGLMLTHAGPKVLEFNVRFGDPECQAVLPRLESDLLDLLHKTAAGRLEEADVAWSEDSTVCVVMASEGYPDKPRTGVPIEGLAEAEGLPGVTVFHAGSKLQGERVVTAGGRVLGVTGRGSSLSEARSRAYAGVDAIRFAGQVVRRDIGATG